MDKYEEKALKFYMSLMNAYCDKKNRKDFDKVEIMGEDASQDLIAILMGMALFHTECTGKEMDLIRFTHVLNHLAIQATFLED